MGMAFKKKHVSNKFNLNKNPFKTLVIHYDLCSNSI